MMDMDNKKTKIEISQWRRYSLSALMHLKTREGTLLFAFETKNNTIKKTLEEAVRRKADLRGADLRWADLQWADLRWADLQGALKEMDKKG